MEQEKKTSIIVLIEAHLSLITVASSLFGIIFTGLFKYISYWYEKGYFDFWEIPMRYMVIDQSNLLIQFFYNFSITVVILIFGILYIELYNSYTKKGRIILHILPLLINIFIVWYVNYRIGGTLSVVLNLKNEEILRFYIWVECFFYPAEIVLIHLFKRKNITKKKIEVKKQTTEDKKKEPADNINEKMEETNHKDIRKNQEKKYNQNDNIFKRGITICLLILAFYIICMVLYISFILYNDRKDKCKDTTKFEVIQDEVGQQYVILTIYEGKVFIKPCTVNEEQHFIVINSDKYRLMELGDKEVNIYNFDDKKDVFELLNNKEYMVLP